jgi:hypothetical protein
MAWAVICAISRGGSVRLDPVGRCDLRRRDLAAHAVDSCDCARRVCADPHGWLLWGTRTPPPVMCPSVFARRTGTSPCGGPCGTTQRVRAGLSGRLSRPGGFSLYQGGWARWHGELRCGGLVRIHTADSCEWSRWARAHAHGECDRFFPSQILAGV